MNIVSTKDILINAQNQNYAVAAFNIYNLETMQGVVEGAWEMKSPVIIATTPSTVDYMGLECIVAMVQSNARLYNIPIALHLDHCKDIDLLKKCIKAGYKSVMIDASLKSYEENIEITRNIVEFAHKYNVTVEAELGRIVGQEDEIKIDEKDEMLTDPKVALDFINKTNVDSLAIAIGTAHGVYKLNPNLDFSRLKEIKEKLDIPLVLHGASGVSHEDIKRAIKYGINKVNIATELKIPFTEAIKEYFIENPEDTDPRNYLDPGKQAIKKVVKKKIEVCESKNKATI